MNAIKHQCGTAISVPPAEAANSANPDTGVSHQSNNSNSSADASPMLYRIISRSRNSPDPLEWFIINRPKSSLVYASALPPELVDSEPARRRIDLLFTEAEADAIMLSIYDRGHYMVEATAVDFPLSRGALAGMPCPGSDECSAARSSAPGKSRIRVITRSLRSHSDE